MKLNQYSCNSSTAYGFFFSEMCASDHIVSQVITHTSLDTKGLHKSYAHTQFRIKNDVSKHQITICEIIK